ncbi:hypothetical protein DXG03_009478 [Asterophora parasitica]|uniref:Splicing factor YJU2 n=1 Tax=Asterophora parasitica TaxID=117018 RepID=A0A9P7G4F4_9AGAR|nr:hypothetical protein DXG03_009478 [Asterophora parasitica]
MSERKVLNKYFPPDFDPELIPRRKQPKNSQQVVRLMAPFSMRCNTCGEYIYKGKKFNARKETVEGEDYYGIKIFRFYIKCTLCSAEITFKTDPKNTDYSAEHGASRNFEPWREEGAVEEEDRLAKLEEEENNPMKALENRTTDSKREMDILDALQDIRARNARNERVGNSVDLIAQTGMEEVEHAEDIEKKRLEEEDEKLIREVFSRVAGPSTLAASGGTESEEASTVVTVKRKADDIEPSLHSLLPESARALIHTKSTAVHATKKKKLDGKNPLGIKLKRPAQGRGKGGLNTEPFDEALDRRIWSLADTRLQWQKRIAETRRTLPQEIETSVLDLLDQHRGTDGDETTAFKDNMVDTADTEIEDYGDVLARYSQMEEVLQRTLALGEELDQTTTSQEERVERVRTVTDEVKSLKV